MVWLVVGAILQKGYWPTQFVQKEDTRVLNGWEAKDI